MSGISRSLDERLWHIKGLRRQRSRPQSPNIRWNGSQFLSAWARRPEKLVEVCCSQGNLILRKGGPRLCCHFMIREYSFALCLNRKINNSLHDTPTSPNLHHVEWKSSEHHIWLARVSINTSAISPVVSQHANCQPNQNYHHSTVVAIKIVRYRYYQFQP